MECSRQGLGDGCLSNVVMLCLGWVCLGGAAAGDLVGVNPNRRDGLRGSGLIGFHGVPSLGGGGSAEQPAGRNVGGGDSE